MSILSNANQTAPVTRRQVLAGAAVLAAAAVLPLPTPEHKPVRPSIARAISLGREVRNGAEFASVSHPEAVRRLTGKKTAHEAVVFLTERILQERGSGGDRDHFEVLASGFLWGFIGHTAAEWAAG